MHEVSLVHALFDQADRAIGGHPAAAVRLIRVRIGELAGVEPQLFDAAFAGCRDERGYGAAALEVVAEAARWRCRGCGATITPGAAPAAPAAVTRATSASRPATPCSSTGSSWRSPMCDVCGCGDPRRVVIDAHAPLLGDNAAQAAHLRAHFLADGVTVLNVMGSPGAGKTALLEATARGLAGRARLASVSGDLATALDAERLAAAGIPSAPITTGSACHLDAAMVHHALHDGPLAAAVRHANIFFIENVGNLICPAIYDLGQQANVVVLSVTEGVDKPLKYPVMFRHADLVVLTKTDLLPHLPEVSTTAIAAALAQVMPAPRLLEVSARTGAGLAAWLGWLDDQRARTRAAATPPR